MGVEMNTGRERSTGARNTFEAYPLGAIRRSEGGESTALVIDPMFRKGLAGLEGFEKVLVVYHKDGALRIKAARLKEVARDVVYLERVPEIEGGALLDIKPFFRELDE
jgi:tRNA (Thr-GGU) A37 N-methylase